MLTAGYSNGKSLILLFLIFLLFLPVEKLVMRKANKADTTLSCSFVQYN